MQITANSVKDTLWYFLGKVLIPSHIANITQILSNAVDGIEYLAQGFIEDGKQDQVIRY